MAHYIYRKLQILKQFHIVLDKSELEHIKSLQSEIQVDNFARTLIKRSWGD